MSHPILYEKYEILLVFVSLQKQKLKDIEFISLNFLSSILAEVDRCDLKFQQSRVLTGNSFSLDPDP